MSQVPSPDNITHRPLRSSLLGVPFRILNMNHKKGLLRGPMGNLRFRVLGLEGFRREIKVVRLRKSTGLAIRVSRFGG